MIFHTWPVVRQDEAPDLREESEFGSSFGSQAMFEPMCPNASASRRAKL
jgi:hypothetical protein